MSTLQAKSIINDKFWIVEKDGEKFATLRKQDNEKFLLSNQTGVQLFSSKESIIQEYGKDFFVVDIVKESNNASENEVYGHPTKHKPENPMFDVQRKLPLYTKSKNSQSIFCAGYYTVKFDKGWVKSFCPKLITLQRNEYKGPFKTELEVKQVLANVSK